MNPRKWALRLQNRIGGKATRLWRRLPLSARVRRRATGPLVWRAGLSQVPVHRLLLGGQNDLTAAEYAARSGDLLWPSRPVSEGPHADLLRRARLGELDDRAILSSPYGEMARTCIRLSGHYFGATDDEGIVRVARDFKAWAFEGRQPLPVPGRSDPDAPVLVAPVRNSDCFQVVDGHHRVAAQCLSGNGLLPARVRRVPVSTPLQDLLDRMSWIGGRRELYQPVVAPELELSWTTVRGCRDRLARMEKLLADVGVQGPGSTYLDVACAYGWFVDGMSRLGFESAGVERDPLAAELGPAAYGIEPHQVVTADAVDFLRSAPGEYDVVSCFSLLHHFVLGRGSVDAESLLRLLDRVTGRVLFLDTGQAHEAWFRDSLREWTTPHIIEFLEEYGTFDRVIDLGPDHDAVPPYEENYARSLFACVRD